MRVSQSDKWYHQLSNMYSEHCEFSGGGQVDGKTWMSYMMSLNEESLFIIIAVSLMTINSKICNGKWRRYMCCLLFRFLTYMLLQINVSFIPFLVFGHFWWRSYENTKILPNLCLHFARQDGQDRGKKWKENHATKVTKIPKTKRRKYGMNETLKNFFAPKMAALCSCIYRRQ